MIHVVEPGLRTTVQDLGRFGFGAHGVPCGGAMDPWALRAANLLVGNEAGAAALEMTLAGPKLVFEHDTVVACVGARCALPPGRAFRVSAGETLDAGKLIDGARSILAVGGGLQGDVVLGSRSTMDARRLRAGDVLTVGEARDLPPRTLKAGAIQARETLRAMGELGEPGELFEARWTVTPDVSRAGVRLSGPALVGGEIEPQGMVAGVVQVPPGGAPIVLGPDGPVTGGYRPVATVITADVGALAYLRPGDEIAFERVTIEQAREAWYVRERALREGIEDAE